MYFFEITFLFVTDTNYFFKNMRSCMYFVMLLLS